MDLINFFERQVKKWNDINQCGQCYEFHAPLTEDALNKQQLENPCCIQVLYTRDNVQAFGTRRTYDNRFGTESDKWEYKNFKLLFAVPTQLGINNHTEVLGHNPETSLSKILQDLENCLLNLELDFCEFVGEEWQILSFDSGAPLTNYRDNNYTGYRINVSIRKRF